MVIGLLQFELIVHGSESLKDKRRVVNSVKDRVQREHMAAVAEVGSLESLTTAVMGLACVGRDGAWVGEMLDHIVEKLRALGDAELGVCRRRIVNFEDVATTGEHGGIDEPALAEEMLKHFEEGDAA